MRRSARLSKNAERVAKEKDFHRKVEEWEEDGLTVIDAGEKGRGVATTRVFEAGDYVCCYRGELVSHAEALRRYIERNKCMLPH